MVRKSTTFYALILAFSVLIILIVLFVIRNKPTVTYISKVPYTINKSGRYELVKNLDCSEKILSPCITINADNVTLDLKGFKVFTSNQDLNRTTYGIWSQEHSHVTITNGEVEGFFMGILLQDVSHDEDYYPEFGFHEISNISVKDNTFRGIRVEGLNNTVTNNIVANTGGTTVFEDAFSIGIESIGSNCLIENNRIVETYATNNGESVGISLTSSGDSQILNNFILNTNDPLYDSWGIWASGITGPYVFNNTIVGYKHGIGFASDAKGLFDNNIIYGAEIPVEFMSKMVIDGGNNRAITKNAIEFSDILINTIDE